MNVAKSQFGQLISLSFKCLHDTTDLNQSFGPSFIVDRLTVSDKIHYIYINTFFESVA